MCEIEASVVICTRNRSKLLREASEAALAGDFPAASWELVIVDNASTDDTAEVASDLSEAHPGRARLVTEQEIGLSSARNTGWRTARGRIVAFLDDDALPERQWLRALVEAFSSPDVMAAGGPIEPIFDGPLPDWFSDRYLPYLGAFDHGPEPVSLIYNEYPRGGNMAFRREVFERFGGFSSRLGLRGDRMLACEETEFCLRIERAGGRLLYAPSAKVYHQIGTTRLTPEWMTDRFAAQGFSEAVLERRHGGFRTLGRGLRRAYRNARAATGEQGAADVVLTRCQQRTFRGYVRGALSSVFFGRYTPEDDGSPAGFG